MPQHRILIVDDEELILSILELSLECLMPGCQIVTVNDGATALTELQQQPFDLILTDYHMPRMNGLELARAARQTFPEIPVILMTGSHNRAEIQTRAGSTIVTGFLAKPFTIPQLRDLLQQNGI
jgi:CheY-like chemotaxis protein